LAFCSAASAICQSFNFIGSNFIASLVSKYTFFSRLQKQPLETCTQAAIIIAGMPHSRYNQATFFLYYLALWPKKTASQAFLAGFEGI